MGHWYFHKRLQNIKRPIVIAGSGRSGTTWVLDAIAKPNGLRTVFEPLHPTAIPEIGAHAYRYLSGDMVAPELAAFLENVFDGSFRSVWSDYRVRPDQLRPHLSGFLDRKQISTFLRRWTTLIKQFRRYHRTLDNPDVVVKFIRANLMLDWMHKTFNPRILFLMRHPGAVVESRLRLGGDDWDPYQLLDRYKRDLPASGEYATRYAHVLSRSLSPAQALATIWCIENQIPFEQAHLNGYLVVSYETLLKDPETEWSRILQGLGLNNAPGQDLIKKPSQQSSSQWKGQTYGESNYNRWLERIGEKDLREVDEILKELGVSVYDAHDPYPKL